MKKIKVLFVTEMSSLGGTERAVIELLKVFPLDKYEVTLRLFGNKSELTKEIPSEIRIQKVNQIRGYQYLVSEFKKLHIGNILMFIKNWFLTHIVGYNRYQDYLNSTVKYDCPDEYYDVAIATHTPLSIPNLYTYSRVNSRAKFLFVHTNVSAYPGCERIRDYFDCFSKIYCVSQAAKQDFIQYFPECSKKTSVLYNRIDIDRVKRLAEEVVQSPRGNKFRIMSCSRLVNEKQPEFALYACKFLLDKGIDNFEWYYIGYGYLLDELKQKAIKMGVDHVLFFPGPNPNPYPLMKSSDLFVNTSANSFETFCLSITEARILNIPVVTTDFDAAKEQITNGVNGFLVNWNSPKELSNCLENILTDKDVLNQLKEGIKEDDESTIWMII